MIDHSVACVLMLGSDVTVRRSVDATVGDGVDHVSLGILPAGSADLFAESLHVLVDLEAAADSALRSEALPTSNVGTLLGGVHAFADALPIPGRLDVATAEKFKIELKSKMPWGVDGGDRTPTKIFEVRCHPGAARVCQPDGAA